jgi:cytochrome c peroxidase
MAAVSAYSLKKYRILLLAVPLLLLLGWSRTDDPIETGVYKYNYPANFGNRITVPADNPTTKQGVYLGRLLFYETRLSATNKISCGSCHEQEKAFTDGKAFSEGINRQPTTRNAMSLVNLLWTRKFFWDGRAASLEEQALVPLAHPQEMGQSLQESALKLREEVTYPPLFKLVFGDETITGQRIAKAISQFERTLISANSPYDRYLQNTYRPTAAELKGMALFAANCDHCHGGVKTYLDLFHNNGLDSLSKDEGIAVLTGQADDRGRFKVPTLRNIELTAPYMHDGRFSTLEEVLGHYSGHVQHSPSLSSFLAHEIKLQPQEKQDIISFLKLLTDSAFIHNPQFSNPNKV